MSAEKNLNLSDDQDCVHQALVQFDKLINQNRARINEAIEYKRNEYIEKMRKKKEEQISIQDVIRRYEQQFSSLKISNEKQKESQKHDERIQKYHEEIKKVEIAESENLRDKFKSLQEQIKQLNQQLAQVERENDDKNKIVELLQYVTLKNQNKLKCRLNLAIKLKQFQVQIQRQENCKVEIIMNHIDFKVFDIQPQQSDHDQLIMRFDRDNDFGSLLYSIMN